MGMLAEIGTKLDTDPAFALTLGTNLFLGQMPESPDDLVAIYEGPGRPSFMMGGEDGVPHLPVYASIPLQIVTRSAGPTAYPTASLLCERIWRSLSLGAVTLSGTRYLMIEPTEMPMPLEEDAKRRISFVVNMTAWREVEAVPS